MKKTLVIIFILYTALSIAQTEVSFKKKKLKIGNQTLTVEVADTQEKAARGLMYRKQLKENEGMLFIFENEEPRSFWMKNTFIPLDIGYFNAKKELIDIQSMTPVTSELQTDIPTYPSKGPAQYALEVPKGWFEKHKIRLKERFSLK